MLRLAYENSDYIVCVYLDNDELIGAGRAITDNAFTVYFPDLLVHKNWQRQGLGKNHDTASGKV
jgi:GNAT superfamily N-acetyltransferase